MSITKKSMTSIKRKALDKQYELSYENKIYFVRMRVQSIIQGYKTAILILGSSGCGKTEAITDELRTTIKEDEKYKDFTVIEINGKISNAKSFYKILWDNNDSKKIIIFDDVNDLLDRNSKSIDVVRAACGESKIRDVYFTDNEITEDSKPYKSLLKLKSRIIFISNLTEAKLQESLHSRLNPYEIVVTPQEMLNYIKKNLENCKPFLQKSIDIKYKQEVINFIEEVELISVCKHFDFRIFSDLVLFRLASKTEDDWKPLVYNLMKKGTRKKM